MGLVNRTTPFEVALSFASVHPVSMDASLKETRATYKKRYWPSKSLFSDQRPKAKLLTVTRVNSVMFAGTAIAANLARYIQ